LWVQSHTHFFDGLSPITRGGGEASHTSSSLLAVSGFLVSWFSEPRSCALFCFCGLKRESGCLVARANVYGIRLSGRGQHGRLATSRGVARGIFTGAPCAPDRGCGSRPNGLWYPCPRGCEYGTGCTVVLVTVFRGTVSGEPGNRRAKRTLHRFFAHVITAEWWRTEEAGVVALVTTHGVGGKTR
jgi:hypothetical protein